MSIKIVEIIKIVQVNVTSNKLCSQKYLKSDEPIKITPEMMCASSPMQDSCQGMLYAKLKKKKNKFFKIII